jgi:hypothetical protein
MIPRFLQRIGQWSLANRTIHFQPTDGRDLGNLPNHVLYGFVVVPADANAQEAGMVAYIGKTRRGLANRLADYALAAAADSGYDGRIGRRIMQELAEGRDVLVYCLLQTEAHLQWDGYAMSLPGALYDSVVEGLAPEWNAVGDDAADGDGAVVPVPPPDGQPNVAAFREAILARMRTAAAQGEEFLEIRSGDIHDELGAEARHPACCQAMRSLHEIGDLILRLPRDRAVNPAGQTFDQQRNGNGHCGSNLVVRYRSAGR